MSRVGKHPVEIVDGVSVEIKDSLNFSKKDLFVININDKVEINHKTIILCQKER